MAEVTNEEQKQNDPRTSGVPIPGKTIKEVKPLLDALETTGLPLTKAVLSDKLSTTIKSSSFMQKVAAAKYYGFVIQEGDKLKITDRGEKVAAGNIIGFQEGFIASSFGLVANSLKGRNADTETVKHHISDKLHVSLDVAKRHVANFLATAAEAELITDNRFKSERLEELKDLVVVAPTSPGSSVSQPRKSTPKEPTASTASQPRVSLSSAAAPQPTHDTGIKVTLNLNTQPLTYDEALRLVQALSTGKFDLSVVPPATDTVEKTV